MRVVLRDPQGREVTFQGHNADTIMKLYSDTYGVALPYDPAKVVLPPGYRRHRSPSPAGPASPAPTSPRQGPAPGEIDQWRRSQGLPPRGSAAPAGRNFVPVEPTAPTPELDYVNQARQQYGREPLAPFSAPTAPGSGSGPTPDEIARANQEFRSRSEDTKLASANQWRRSQGLPPIDRLFGARLGATPSPAVPTSEPQMVGPGPVLVSPGSPEAFQPPPEGFQAPPEGTRIEGVGGPLDFVSNLAGLVNEPLQALTQAARRVAPGPLGFGTNPRLYEQETPLAGGLTGLVEAEQQEHPVDQIVGAIATDPTALVGGAALRGAGAAGRGLIDKSIRSHTI